MRANREINVTCLGLTSKLTHYKKGKKTNRRQKMRKNTREKLKIKRTRQNSSNTSLHLTATESHQSDDGACEASFVGSVWTTDNLSSRQSERKVRPAGQSYDGSRRREMNWKRWTRQRRPGSRRPPTRPPVRRRTEHASPLPR